MRHLFVITNKLFKKGIALILLSALTTFSFVFNFAFFFYRLVAVTFAAVGTAITAVDCYKYGFTADRGVSFLILFVMVALRYLLPLLSRAMQQWNEGLRGYVFAPMSFRPPVRYTI